MSEEQFKDNNLVYVDGKYIFEDKSIITLCLSKYVYLSLFFLNY